MRDRLFSPLFHFPGALSPAPDPWPLTFPPVDVQVDVGIDPQASLLHVAVGNAEIVKQQFQFGEIRLGLFRRSQVGLADDFQKRRAGPIQVDGLSALPATSSCMACRRLLRDGPEECECV